MKVNLDRKKNVLAALCIILLIRPERNRNVWVHPINQMRHRIGAEVRLKIKLRKYPDQFKDETRLTPAQFKEILSLIRPHIQRQSNRGCISPTVRLLVTLKYLAEGTSKKEIARNFCLGHTTVCSIISETTEVLWKVLSPIYMPELKSEDWHNVASEFETLWNFPHCVGALDGKHVTIKNPANSGSLFFNYKKNFSVNLMAISDANYRFIMVDVGAYGYQNDSSVFRESEFGKKLFDGRMNFPVSEILEGGTLECPYFLVADDAFPFCLNILKPYPGINLQHSRRIFNYRLSRARRCVENAFGVLANRFRIFHTQISAKPVNIDNVIKAACVLHNFLITSDLKGNTSHYMSQGDVDTETTDCGYQFQQGRWRSSPSPYLSPVFFVEETVSDPLTASCLRENLSIIFSKFNILPWQDAFIRRKV